MLVLATDGVWDNLPLQYIAGVREKGIPLEEKAKVLTGLAKEFGMSPDFESPFYLKAK